MNTTQYLTGDRIAHPRAKRCGLINNLRGILFLSASIVLSSTSVFAGTIRGSVSSSDTNNFLERALVRVEGTNIKALTEKNGTFVISGVPAGNHTLIATYSGLEPDTISVSVGEGETAYAYIELASEHVFELEAFVVDDFAEGVAFARNQQRNAESVRTVTSVDTFIDTVTGNPGEFLKNLQGVQMDYSQNEPNKIRVRGIDPNLTTVTMDGNEIAGAASSGTNRALEIDQLTISGISNVEVFKAPVPWMSANAVGGAVNFQTKSAFDVKGRRSSITLGVNTDSHDFLGKSDGPGHGNGAERRIYPVGRFDYTNTLLDNRLGVFFSVGRDHTNQLGSSVISDFRSPNAILEPRNGGAVADPPAQLTYEDAVLERQRLGYSPNRQLRTRTDGTLNLDYKVSDNMVLFLKSTHSEYHSTNRNHSFGVTVRGKTEEGSDWDGYTATGVTPTQGISVFEKYTKSTQLNAGMRFIDENWKIDFNIADSTSNNKYINPWHFSSLAIKLSDPVSLTVGHRADSEVPTSVVQNSGPDMYDLNNYVTGQGTNFLNQGEHWDENGMVRKRARDSTEDRLTSKLDVRRYFNGENRFYLQAGISFNEVERDINRGEEHYYWVGEDGAISEDDYSFPLGMFAEPVPVTLQLRDAGHIREPVYFDTNSLQRYWEENPQVLQLNTAKTQKNYLSNLRNIKEEVIGYYAMGNLTVDKLNILAGVRFEDTDVAGVGPRQLPYYDSTNGETATGPNDVDLNGANPKSLAGINKIYSRQAVSDGYSSDPFPYLHVKYDWTPQFLTRFSYTESIGRPNFGELIPNVSEDVIDQEITVTNAALKPQRSENLDFSAEFYAENGLELTFGWFTRDISNFIQDTDLILDSATLAQYNLGSEYDGWLLETSGNIGYAKWSGVEASFRVPFARYDNLPQFLRNFEVFGNYTNIYKMDKDLDDGTPKTDINNVVPNQYNSGVTYRSPDGKLLLRLSTNYQGIRIFDDYPVTSASRQDRNRQEVYQFYNFEGSYQATERMKLILAARNLGEERNVRTQYGVVTYKQQDTGVAYTLSVKYDL